ncbi:hypothetical protein [Methylotenera sp. G11]|uniref:hypothetical protein n=1 Tax=Methylotenera sp. G11 TaxID=1506585 RepID=UPI000A64281E|nr:hypothetical protein [Methylotenera sp. G11]
MKLIYDYESQGKPENNHPSTHCVHNVIARALSQKPAGMSSKMNIQNKNIAES